MKSNVFKTVQDEYIYTSFRKFVSSYIKHSEKSTLSERDKRKIDRTIKRLERIL